MDVHPVGPLFHLFADYPNSQAIPRTEINPTEAAANIDAFLKSHAFNFEYKIDSTDMWGKYYVTPLTPDGFAVHIEDLHPSGLLFTLDGSGQVASVQANLVDYQPAGTYGIRTAQDAWKILLDPDANPASWSGWPLRAAPAGHGRGPIPSIKPRRFTVMYIPTRPSIEAKRP